jgi:hypothetical protein
MMIVYVHMDMCAAVDILSVWLNHSLLPLGAEGTIYLSLHLFVGRGQCHCADRLRLFALPGIPCGQGTLHCFE